MVAPALNSDRDQVSGESGFSVIEVIVAIAIITVIAAATATLTIGGLGSASVQERRQIAVTVANGVLETVIARSPAIDTTSTVSGLYTGRTKAKVDAAWATGTGRDGVAATYPRWDPKATSSSAAALPITRSVTNSGITYTTTLLVGTCYIEDVDPGSCVKLPGITAAPSTTPAGYTAMIRVIALVTWIPGEGCGPDGCIFEAATLIDPNTDLEWIYNG